ncbi:MAG: caspase family protein [Planctomycetia bacterium]|nr:caspase family protein [Planctomycetia bacterium]
MATLKIMGIHGLGDHRNDPWDRRWKAVVEQSLGPAPGPAVDFIPFRYDDIFARITISPWESLKAFGKLAGSGIVSGVDWLLGRRAVARGPLDSAQYYLRWYAGYVVAWVENKQFRSEVRRRLLAEIDGRRPDLILAHSLGSLISYDAITSPEIARNVALQRHLQSKVIYVTLGSQLGNAFVTRNLTPGRIVMPPAESWYHLYNSEDDVFTAPVRLPGEPKFLQLDTYFDIEGFADHDAIEYLKHPATVGTLWQPLAMESARVAGTSARTLRRAAMSRFASQVSVGAVRAEDAERRRRRARGRVRTGRQRALLVGINDYPDPGNRLAGCVNDVFLMSSVIQECGFGPDQIRVVLDDRATAKGILDRMSWLVDGAAPGDTLFFFYSGHGAQVPAYNAEGEVDRTDETLVPFDFDWSKETSVADDQIYGLYSQLPYDTRLVMVFDCCHSGGIHRDGGPKIRGLTPPDDVRHRALKWRPDLNMWVPRDLPKLNREFSDVAKVQRQFTGASGSVLRLGRAMQLRGMTRTSYAQYKRRSGERAVGPYLPVILEACQEDQYAYEYRHGVTSYGAFTYSLADILRRRKKISFEDLVKETGNRLVRELKYDQRPAILGPKAILRANVPWMQNGRPGKPAAGA